jgi:hypothetical protein
MQFQNLILSALFDAQFPFPLAKRGCGSNLEPFGTPFTHLPTHVIVKRDTESRDGRPLGAIRKGNLGRFLGDSNDKEDHTR